MVIIVMIVHGQSTKLVTISVVSDCDCCNGCNGHALRQWPDLVSIYIALRSRGSSSEEGQDMLMCSELCAYGFGGCGAR